MRIYPNTTAKTVKNLAFILFCLTIVACEETTTYQPEQPVEQVFEPNVTYDAIFKDKLLGDFDGDGEQDELIETLISSINNTSIDALPQLEYDSLVEFIHAETPTLSLQSVNGTVPELIITKNTSFGLLWIKNEGDLNKNGGDEISVVIDWADWSQVNNCIVYSLQKNNWIEYAKFRIRESQITQNKGFNGFIRKNEHGAVVVSTFDSEMNETTRPISDFISPKK